MSKNELRKEIDRVEHLLATDKNYFTQKQNRKYLKKLKRRLYAESKT